jgi:oxaloacetate decarboxylase alpha subunit
MALGTSQPPTETVVSILQGTPRDPGLDLAKLTPIARYFAEVRRRYAMFEGELIGVDTNVMTYQVPGGMISNLISQLRELNALDRLDEVLAEVPRVRADLGYPPLVTPSSQFVGAQAVMNVLQGERYKVVLKEVAAYARGLYGRPPAPMDEAFRRKLAGGEPMIEGRPADLLEPELEKAREEIGDLARSEEDVLSYALFPQIAREFFRRRERGEKVEREVVAAIGAALQQTQHERAPVAAAVARAMASSPWKRAGREALLAARL